MDTEDMVNSLESDKSKPGRAGARRLPGWIKVGAVAAASVLAGGLAATWLYRKSISRLQHSEEIAENPNFGSHEGQGDDEI